MERLITYYDDPQDCPLMKAQLEYLNALMNKYKTQKVIYENLNCNKSMVSNWFRGKRLMPITHAFMIESILDEREIRFVDYLSKNWVQHGAKNIFKVK